MLFQRITLSNLFIILILIISDHLTKSQIVDYPITNFSSNWIRTVSLDQTSYYQLGTDINLIPILLRQTSSGLAFACGFFNNAVSNGFMFGVVILRFATPLESPQIVWTANRNNPIKINSTLNFTSPGSLVLSDVDGSIVWSPNTDGRSFACMNLTYNGNLMLFDENNVVVWQSFDYPTDSLAPGQVLQEGQRLISSVSDNNVSEGIYSCYVKDNKSYSAIGSNPPEIYVRFSTYQLQIGAISSDPNVFDYVTKLDPDGHLRRYHLGSDWGDSTDVLARKLSPCKYPMVCGEYSICQNEQCSCPQPRNASVLYFQDIDIRQPNLGCKEVTPLDCNAAASSSHHFVEIEQAMYFTFRVDINHTDVNHCMQVCLGNCSCKAVFFRYDSNPYDGDCYLPTRIYSLLDNWGNMSIYHISVFLKVQSESTSVSALVPLHNIAPSDKPSVAIIYGSVIGALLSLVITSVSIILVIRRRIYDTELDDQSFENHVKGMPARFSLNDLKIACENFSVKLGEGGFGEVFEGTFPDGTKIAVKRLDGVGKVKRSFLAEVGSIGNIHHVNLVRLIGYCAENSQRLLVYEYMYNGSLDKWIDYKRRKFPLSWKCRKQIMLDIAKGLAYLHEDCRQKIIHLDVKPENILLNEKFEAKLSDFGLSKLLSRDQSNIHTTIRGTPGYLAPEWLSSFITEKADVYSFGVVMMEILSGRKIIDESLPEDQVHLLSVFIQKSGAGKLDDMVDKSSEDMISNGVEVVEMMQVALWCLQNDYLVRPSMSLVVKVLEGIVDVDLSHLDYRFIGPLIFAAKGNPLQGTLLYPSVLSGPR